MDKILIEKLDATMVTINNGNHFSKVGELIIGRERNATRIQVFGYTKHSKYCDVKKMEVKTDLDNIKERFLTLYEESKAFKYAINKSDIDYYLQFDYGTGSFTLCKEKGGVFSYDEILNEPEDNK